MGFRFRRSIKVLPGVRLNFGKKGLNSLSVGRRGASVNFSNRGTRRSIGLPGTGLSYSTFTPRQPRSGIPTFSSEIRPSEPELANEDLERFEIVPRKISRRAVISRWVMVAVGLLGIGL